MSITFAGISSDSVNLIVERYPARPIPSRRYTVQTIPGRSGSLLMDEEAFNNIEQAYEIYIRENGATTFQESVTAAAAWLLAPSGYQRLVDSYDPDIYRMAYFSGTASITNALNRLGRATIKFNCKPWRYLNSGDTAVTVSGSGSLTNPTQFASRPKIVLTGTGAGTIGIGSYTVTLSDCEDGLTIDCETMDCYTGSVNRNSWITLSPTYEYPELVPGVNNVEITGSITAAAITPYWRTL